MKRHFKWILALIVLGFILRIVFTTPLNKRISEALGIVIPRNIDIDYEDTHGGFHGDGYLVAKIKFKGMESEQVLSNIKDNSNWRPFPLTENIERALYEFYSLAEKVDMPKMDKGYWFLIDRFGGEIRGNDDTRLLSRSAANFTAGVYDSVNNILYYYELDT